MYREMRRKAKETDISQSIRILENGEYGILSTIDSNNQPYGIPLSYVLKDNLLYFHCASEGHKIDNINFEDKVSFCVVGETQIQPSKFTTKYESVIVFGKAEVLEDSSEKKKALLYLCEKYSPDFLEEANVYIDKALEKTTVFRIKIEHISGKENK
ncbi:pyridoxamine 5'-phosphate oxidase-like protein, FMN-binding [Gottschalkia purinilytica]|uniref:Pyridoxamine 5'-phosphate oxidase-like protein, FMN-binding n=1 Tax=Gottschalkia purinilytica TaxID=1503 RepID=A0A0L0W646_GOTPU|nr:pyridoxamine 5'-phosphate oxidase family protein [Gottschalkia purinilytica]KNF06998.1 pyridoxamine 5'-phosphate oxidase-like protein, FMN-binding [Gottschalkia purinilytica]